MERKRVKVFRPQGGTMSKYQPGGQIGSDQGGEAEMVIQAYVQAKQMSEQEAQQFIQSFMQMQPDQQQMALSKMSEELMAQSSSGMGEMSGQSVPMGRLGGDLLKAKKGLSKTIKSVAGQNTTSDNVVEGRAKTIMNVIGNKMMTNMIDKEYQKADQMNKSQSMNVTPYEDNMMQMNMAQADSDSFLNGGSYNYNFGPFYGGYANPADNPMIQNFYGMRNNLNNAGQNFIGALGDLAEDSQVTGIKTRAVGPMFRQMRKQDEMSMSKYGGTRSFQPGGTYTADEINMALDDLGVADEDYHQAIKEGRQDSDAVNRVNTYIETLRRQRNLGQGQGSGWTRPNTYAEYKPKFGWERAGMSPEELAYEKEYQKNYYSPESDGYTGNLGGFYFENGQLKFGQPGTQGGQGMPGGFGGFPAASSMQNLLGTYGAGAIGRAFQMMTPEDVYMNKFKASAGLLGPRVVAKWKYKPDGSVERADDYDDTERNVRDAFGNLTTERRARESFQDPTYLRQMGLTPEADETVDRSGFINRGKLFNNRSEREVSDRDIDRAIGRDQGKIDRNIRRYERRTGESFPGDVSGAPMTNVSSTPSPLIEVPNSESLYGDWVSGMPGSNMPMIPDFEVGGRAGKLVMRNTYQPSVGGVGRFLSPTMDFASIFLQAGQTPENEAAYTPPSFGATLRSDMPMSRGVYGRGPGVIGQQIPNLQPDYSEAYRFPQNPGELSSMQPNYGEYGGTFQYGGSFMDDEEDVYYLDENEIADIMKRGGQIEYL